MTKRHSMRPLQKLDLQDISPTTTGGLIDGLPMEVNPTLRLQGLNEMDPSVNGLLIHYGVSDPSWHYKDCMEC